MKNKASILVIDDEQIVCDSCHRILENEELKVESNTNSVEGYQNAIKNDWDLILLDLNMPEMDGMKLLSKIRKDKPGVPVIIITGYPSKETRNDSEKLGVQNYILKPFKPEELLNPVKSIIAKIGQKEGKTEKQFMPMSDKQLTMFYKNGWIQLGADNLVRVGGLLPVEINETVKSIRTVLAKESIHRGLPIAEINYGNDIKIVIPSAISGEIKEVNAELVKTPSLFDNEDKSISWVATVMPEALEEDLRSCETRSLLLLSKEGKDTGSYMSKIVNLGYEVSKVVSEEEAIKEITEKGQQVIVLDGKSFSASGPQIAEKIKERFPETKIVVFNETDAKLETLYREKQVYYYAVDPISSKEISGILYGAFCFSRDGGEAENSQTTFLPVTISRLQITNRHSQNVSLLAFDNVLQFDKGVGYMLIQNLLSNSYPLETDHTRTIVKMKDSMSQQKISEEKQKKEKVIIFCKEELGKIPGNIVKSMEKYENNNGANNQLIRIAVQPENMNSDEIKFDINTSKALAEILEIEMTRH